ncbi:MAG: alkaline phosphatase family protein, partial [Bacteroidaceae bacterium]|nr:alkaline phosphatase family protein [Bacteroidaceae bacterium]
MTTQHRYTLLASLLLLASLAKAQTVPELPRIVVNIFIDQLRSDYLEAFSPLYGEGGFMRLMREGKMYTQAEYPFAAPDRASSIACFATGTSPYENGIVGLRWLDRQTLSPVFCVEDKNFAGIETAERLSPQYLGVSTLGDEMKVASDGAAVVLSVAPQSDEAILSAGHAADGAFWIDDATGSWCSTSYYFPQTPKWLYVYEGQQSLGSRIKNIVWEPLNESVGNFNYFVAGGVKKPFSHKFISDRRFREMKASPCVNEEVNRFVEHLMHYTSLGVDGITDMLNVTYYAGVYDHRSITEYGMEMQDTYARLDRDLEHLINLVERRAGKGNALFVVTSTGYTDPEQVVDLSKFRIPTGTFSITKARLLLNMYLIAVYGPGQYVETALGNELYLNLKLIESRNINLAEMQERCADFLIQLTGVRDVFTSQRLAYGGGAPGISKLR